MPSVRVSREIYDDKQAAEVQAAPNTVLAKSMKTRLIRPRASTGPDGGDEWSFSATGADNSPYDGAGCRVAILDTGIDAQHRAFNGVTLIEEDFSGSGNGDREGHGTHCAGTIFGRDVDGRRIGVARGISRALIGKVLDDTGAGDSISIYQGLTWAFQHHAQVISLSVGMDFPGQVDERVNAGWPIELATSEALIDFANNLKLFEALRMVVSTAMLGVEPLIVAAAGNESRRNADPDFVVAPSLPASALHLSVGAVGRDGVQFRIADFSNAPPDVVAPGMDIVSAAIGGGLIAQSGTSMACPHVVGLAALYTSKLGELKMRIDATSLRSALIASTSRDRLIDFDEPGIRNYGDGIVNAPMGEVATASGPSG